MQIINSAPEADYMASRVPDTNGCYVIPAFTGLAAPYWDQYARGTVVGLTRGVNKYHFIRATLESIAYSTYDLAMQMEKDLGSKIKSLKIDGGASRSDFLMQVQSDLLDKELLKPTCIETTAMGAAYLAGLAVGYWKNQDEIKKNWKVEKVFKNSITKENREKRIKGWHKAVKYAMGWAKDE